MMLRSARRPAFTAGGTRLLQTPRGYRNTIKSGAVTFQNGEWTGETPGALIRGERG